MFIPTYITYIHTYIYIIYINMYTTWEYAEAMWQAIPVTSKSSAVVIQVHFKCPREGKVSRRRKSTNVRGFTDLSITGWSFNLFFRSCLNSRITALQIPHLYDARYLKFSLIVSYIDCHILIVLLSAWISESRDFGNFAFVQVFHLGFVKFSSESLDPS